MDEAVETCNQEKSAHAVTILCTPQHAVLGVLRSLKFLVGTDIAGVLTFIDYACYNAIQIIA